MYRESNYDKPYFICDVYQAILWRKIMSIKTDELWVCSECGTDFKDEEDYLEHLELGCEDFN